MQRVDVLFVNSCSLAAVALACVFKQRFPEIVIRNFTEFDYFEFKSDTIVVMLNCVRQCNFEKLLALPSFIWDDRPHMKKILESFPKKPMVPRMPVVWPIQKDIVNSVWNHLYPDIDPMSLLNYVGDINMPRIRDIRLYLSAYFSIEDIERSKRIFSEFDDCSEQYAEESNDIRRLLVPISAEHQKKGIWWFFQDSRFLEEYVQMIPENEMAVGAIGFNVLIGKIRCPSKRIPEEITNNEKWFLMEKNYGNIFTFVYDTFN